MTAAVLIRALATAAFVAVTAVGAAGTPSPAPSGTPQPADPRAWPQTYEAATITAADLLASARRSRGTRNAETARTVYDITEGGLTGVERDVWRGDDFRSDTTLGPFITADGRYKGEQWEMGENGYTLLKRGLHQRAEANARALERLDAKDDVHVLGRLRAPADVYVLRLAPPDGREERRFYDATMFRLVRRETTYLKRLVVSTYDDYRTVNGYTQAYRTTFSDGRPGNDSVRVIRDFAPGAQVAEAEVAVPEGRRAPVIFPAGVDRVRLPARMDRWGRIIVRITINGRGLDFQLDSGASSIVLDKTVAEQLGLKVHGRWTQSVAGTFTTGLAVVPRLQIGTIVMDDAVVHAMPFREQMDEHTKIVGLLGFDFLAGGVIKIDYQNGTVDAMRYDAAIPKDALVMDAILDDGVPLIEMAVNGVAGKHFLVDTGADDVLLFSGFTRDHPAVAEDHSPGKFLSILFPAVTVGGVGGRLNVRILALEKMQIGPVTFKDFLSFVMSGDQPSFEGEEMDGIIGASVLSSFDVYLDYANSRVGLALNRGALEHKPARGVGSGRE